MRHQLPIEITQEDGLWMARSSAIQGLLVTGASLDQLFSELQVVSLALYDTCKVQGWSFVKGRPDVALSDIAEYVNKSETKNTKEIPSKKERQKVCDLPPRGRGSFAIK